GRSEVGATTLRVGLRANDVGFSNESPSAQLTLAALLVLRLRDRCLRRCDPLGSLRQRGTRGATHRRQCLLFLGNLCRADRDLAPQEQGAPDSEERSNEDEAEYGRPRAIGLERSQSVRERDGHGYRPSDEKRRGVSKNTARVARPPGTRSSLVGRAPGGVVS